MANMRTIKVGNYVVLCLVCCFAGADLLFYSCQKENSCENCGGNPANTNKSPQAIAGPDQVISLPTDTVLLNGNASHDPDGTIIGFVWKNLSSPGSPTITSPTTPTTKVKNLVQGIFVFELKVTDNGGRAATDTMSVFVNVTAQPNRPPVAKAGSDQTISLPTNVVNLDGSGSTDPDNNIASYIWTKIAGPSPFNISNATSMQTQVVNLVQGTYWFELKVTDTGGLFSTDTMQITVNSAPAPCAAGRTLVPAQLIPFGTLSGPKSNVAVGAAGTKIVFAGGYDGDFGLSSVDIYDVATQAWSTAQLSAPRFDMAVATCGSKIFFAGGYYTDGFIFDLSMNVDIYDASTNTWSVDSLSSARNGLAAASVGNKVFFGGGTTTNYSVVFSNTVDIYDMTTNTWSTTTLSEARGYLSAVSVGNKIYFAGGENGLVSYSKRIDIYDNATSSWSTGTLNEPKARMASIAFAGKIYWVGGVNSATTTNGFWIPSSEVEIKDASTQTSTLDCLFQPNIWMPHATCEKNNKLVFFTGYGGVGVINKFDIYDILSHTWSVGELSRDLHSASIISVNNTIYVAGGVTGVVSGTWSDKIWKLEF